jgi:CBS domain-containing protein
MTVRSIMSTDPLTLHADDTVGKAVELLLGKRYIMIAVVDADRCYRGEFDIWDLLRLLLPRAATLDDDLVPDLRFIADDLPATHPWGHWQKPICRTSTQRCPCSRRSCTSIATAARCPSLTRRAADCWVC